jgi:gliding motility-associated-like protein
MKSIILLIFTFTLLWGSSQQVITMCKYSKKEFTYTTDIQQSGIYIWDINGQFMPTTSNSLIVDWSTYGTGVYVITVYFENLFGCYPDPIDYTVLITDCNESFMYVPNAFTPNSDTHNNIWKPIIHNIDEGWYLIFNRWGEIIYESYNLEVGWPGTYGSSSRMVQDGVYVYVIEYVNVTGIKEKLIGHITLLR